MDGSLKAVSTTPSTGVDELPLEMLLDELNQMDGALREIHMRRNDIIKSIRARVAYTREYLNKSEESTNTIYSVDSRFNPEVEDSSNNAGWDEPSEGPGVKRRY